MFYFKKNISNNSVNIYIVFDIGEGSVYDNRVFNNINTADAYILSCKKSYILIMFEKLVYELSLQSNTLNKSEIETLNRLKKYVAYFPDKDFSHIIFCLSKLKNNIFNLVFQTNNNSSSSKIYNFIYSFISSNKTP